MGLSRVAVVVPMELPVVAGALSLPKLKLDGSLAFSVSTPHQETAFEGFWEFANHITEIGGGSGHISIRVESDEEHWVFGSLEQYTIISNEVFESLEWH